MAVVTTRSQLPEEFERLTMTPNHFHLFYTIFIGLRFPMEVAEVLDLRYLINHAVDDFNEPPLTPDYREFQQSLEKELDSLSVENQHHRERLLKTLALIRELHASHVSSSLNAEETLCLAMEDNHVKRRHTVQYGLIYILVSALTIVGWFLLPEPNEWAEWLPKILTLLCALQAWKCFHVLPQLDQRGIELRQQLNELLRQRVNAISWKTIINKLSLVLGFKKIDGIEVFRMESEHAGSGPYH